MTAEIEDRIEAAAGRLAGRPVQAPQFARLRRRRSRARAGAAAIAVGVVASSATLIVARGDDRASITDQPATTASTDPDTTVVTTAPSVVDESPSSSAAITTTSITATLPPTTVPSESPITQLLSPGSSRPIPAAPIGARSSSAFAWSGKELIVWGGYGTTGTPAAPSATDGTANDGAAFDVAAGTWRTLAPGPLSARSSAASVWTGTELLVWGGVNGSTELSDGAAYDPTLDKWQPIAAGGPTNTGSPLAVWDGTEMIVIGGSFSGPRDPSAAAYNPVTDTWRTLAHPPGNPQLPIARAVWFDNAVYVLGLGQIPDAPPPVGGRTDNSYIHRYDPANDTWTELPTPVAGSSLVATNDSLLLLNPRPFAQSASLSSDGQWELLDGPPPGTPLATGTAVWTGEDVVFSDGSDFAVVYRPSTRQWGKVADGTNWNRATANVVAADGLVARWSGYPLNPTTTSDPAGLLMRMPDDLPEAAPPAPAVANAPALADILGTDPADHDSDLQLAVPDLSWTLSLSNGQTELIDGS
ncbi:MAG: hypothetical protein JWL72_3829, partial [Ilumatobacteraceae bacterium]|nr:hypothetical protein [Ilumatobacteraceae bacterium]